MPAFLLYDELDGGDVVGVGDTELALVGLDAVDILVLDLILSEVYVSVVDELVLLI